MNDERDARLAARALGGLDPAAAAALEAEIGGDPVLRAEAEAFDATAAALREGFAAEAVPALPAAARAAILRGTSAEPIPVVTRSRALAPLAVALLLTLGLALAGGGHGSDRNAGRGARVNPFDKQIEVPGYSSVVLDDEVGLAGQLSLGYAGSAGGRQALRHLNSPLDGIDRGGLGGAGGGGGGGAPSVKAEGEFGTFFTLTGAGPHPHPPVLRARTVRANESVGVLRDHLEALRPDGGGGGDGNAVAEVSVAEGMYVDLDLDDATTATHRNSHRPFVENSWIRPLGDAALSTFSIDVDTAAYSIVRRCLVEQGTLPPPGALRLEEMVNYFPYGYEGPTGADPFAVRISAAACPWAPRHRLVRIALKGRTVADEVRPPANVVFLVDVSGSMGADNKLPLAKASIALLAEKLDARDRISIVVYAGAAGLVLPPTSGADRAAVKAALDGLGAGGSTAGGAGIELAYKIAAENFVTGGINRVVLATDGDWNVGVSDPSALQKLIEEKAKSGVFLTVLGYGMDNLRDDSLETLADRGNGNYGYVDGLAEARKILVDEGMSTLHAIAKDVKIQVEWNPAKVAGYRLLGYENRALAAQDFADDAKDAGEIGAGHAVTALYEVVPAGVEVPGAPVDGLRFQAPGFPTGHSETLLVKLRWKEPEGTVSTAREFPYTDGGAPFEAADDDFRFASAVAAFGMVLRESANAGSANLPLVREIASGALGDDPGGWRKEFLGLVEKAAALKK